MRKVVIGDGPSTTITVNAPVAVDKNATSVTYTVIVDYEPETDLIVTIEVNGVSQNITIKAGATTAKFDVAVGNNCTITAEITESMGGNYEDVSFDNTNGTVKVICDVDITTISVDEIIVNVDEDEIEPLQTKLGSLMKVKKGYCKLLSQYKSFHNSPFFDKVAAPDKEYLNKNDYEFMNSLSAAVMQIRPNRLHWVLVSFAVTIFLFITWASFAKIDEISRGSGKVVPSGQNQILQNLEGGIISEILVKEGDFVKQGQILIRINNEKSESSVVSGTLKALFLKAQTMRLKAELQQFPFKYELTDNEQMNQFLENENRLFVINKQQLESQVQILKEQLNQKNNQLEDTIQQKEHLKISLSMISREVEMTEPMVKRGIRSQVDFLKLQREENDAKQKSLSSALAVKKTRSEIKETKNKINEVYESNKAEVSEKLNEKTTELKELEATLVGYEDQVDRTIIKSPSNGIVQKLHVNTIGGSIKPAQDLIEIVPTDFNLIVEVKILPSDIAFIYQGQNAIVKFSAYDFSIFGGLKGHVINISPDTITDKDEKTFYLVRIQTEKNFLGSKKDARKIIPGMIADVDIITGKKSILDYILKPILKTKQYTFTER